FAAWSTSATIFIRARQQLLHSKHVKEYRSGDAYCLSGGSRAHGRAACNFFARDGVDGSAANGRDRCGMDSRWYCRSPDGPEAFRGDYSTVAGERDPRWI